VVCGASQIAGKTKKGLVSNGLSLSATHQNLKITRMEEKGGKRQGSTSSHPSLTEEGRQVRAELRGIERTNEDQSLNSETSGGNKRGRNYEGAHPNKHV